MKLSFFQRRKIKKKNDLMMTYINYVKNPGKCCSCKYLKTGDAGFGYTFHECKLKELSFNYEGNNMGSCKYHEPQYRYRKAIRYCKDSFYQGGNKNELTVR